ncbi:SapC family protein [Sphingomonadaceae bacterium LXI357]|uniref:SapC family protein n=2 Tax=Stakelama marina TaxID=2826939 RepID=A0A8T4IAJ2_9SPHN|nr:SapC family protein [Stakelama marina]MBR0552038.1 SapC family protein [Stakelama marina]
MANLALLNNVDHHDLRIRTGHGAEFGDAISQALIFPTEFEAVAREYPIFFRKDEQDEFQAVALLGLAPEENLFLDGERWDARYIPAIQQRGPFSIGLQRGEDDEAAEPMIQIDLDHPRVSRDEGEPIFLEHGGNTPLLEGMSDALRRLYVGLQRNKPMFDAFAAHDLVEPVSVEIRLNDEQQIDLTSFFTIGQDRFATLDGDALARLNAEDFLRPAVWAMSSLGNVQRLIERKNRIGAAG